MKAIYKGCTLILFTVLAQHANAQNMRAVNNVLSQHSMQFNMQMQQNMMRQMMFNYDNGINPKYDYLVTMNDSSKIVVRSKIYSDTAKHKTYLLFVDKNYSKNDTNRNKKIYVSQTLSIARNLGGRGSKEVWYKGVSADSCWMFKAVSGIINAYSAFSFIQPDGFGFSPPVLMGIQKGDGPIVELTLENLKPMVGQDIDALEYIQRKNYYKAIKKYNHNAEKVAKK